MSPASLQIVSGLLHFFDALSLGEGDADAGANLLAAMALSISNVQRPGAAIHSASGSRFEVGCGMVVSGPDSSGLVSGQIVRPLRERQQALNGHVLEAAEDEARRAENTKRSGHPPEDPVAVAHPVIANLQRPTVFGAEEAAEMHRALLKRSVGMVGRELRVAGLGTLSLFGVYSVRIINEKDRCTREAQDLLLSYLDRLPPGRAVIGTSNLQLDLLTERFQTRFQSIKLMSPSTDDIAALLRRHWPVDRATAARIAVGSGSCVRAALADLETRLDAEGLS